MKSAIGINCLGQFVSEFYFPYTAGAAVAGFGANHVIGRRRRLARLVSEGERVAFCIHVPDSRCVHFKTSP